MSTARKAPDLPDDLVDLRAESLGIVNAFAGIAGVLWLAWIVNPFTGGAMPPAEAWIGSGLLILAAYAGHTLRKHRLRAASIVVILGTLAATVCAMLVFGPSDVAYLLILPIVFSSLLLDQWCVFPVAVAADATILILGATRMGVPPLSAETLIPIVVISLVTIVSWLGARNLYTALAWVWYGYARALHNEEIARDRQAELRRVLKALDEATYRLERTNYMLALARDQAEEARRLKQQFAQTISHELRTPLNLIVGFTELMTESPEHYGGSLPPAYLRDLSIVHRNACHLQTLVGDVLDLARVEAAHMGLVLEETDPAALAREAVETARSLVEARGLALHTEIEENLPRLWLDPTRIRQVLFNLLNNAARFTEEGSVTVGVREVGREVIFTVADTGTGIAPEDRARLFEEFQQLDGTTRRRHGGAGLGLAISRRFVELHGGRIWVESQVGSGSRFHFSLPVDSGDVGAIPASLRATSAVAGRPGEPILLAVTRSSSAGALMSRYVQRCRTIVVPDLEQAKEAAAQLVPQAVVIDRACGLPDGMRLEDLAREWGLSHACLAVCPLPGEEPARQQLGVDGYLIKPLSRQSLRDALRRVDTSAEKVLIVDDDQDFALLLGRMLEDNPIRSYRVITAYSGREGLIALQHHQPDLILLDLVLPDMHGSEVIQKMRAMPSGQRIPIIVVSGQDEVHDEALSGSLTIAKANGLLPGEIVRWVQGMIDSAIMVPPVLPARRATSPR